MPSAMGAMDMRNGNLDDVDDEMELAEFYSGAGSQSVDCEASPPPLQVSSTGRISKRLRFLIN